MNKIAVVILGRIVFANYNAFTLGSVVLFFAVGLALMLGGGNGKPNAMHVAAEAAKTTIGLARGEVEGVSTQTASPTAVSASPTSSSVSLAPKKSHLFTLSSDPTIATTPPTVPVPMPDPIALPTPLPTPIPDPTPVVPFTVGGPDTLTLAIGSSVVVPFTTSDNSMATWTLTSGANTTGPIFIFPDANPVLASSYTFSLVAQATAVVGNQMTFTVHAVDTTRNLDIAKSLTVTIVAAPTPSAPPTP